MGMRPVTEEARISLQEQLEKFRASDSESEHMNELARMAGTLWMVSQGWTSIARGCLSLYGDVRDGPGLKLWNSRSSTLSTAIHSSTKISAC